VVYSGLWTPGKLIFYLNGEAIAEYLGDFGTSMNLIANISVAQKKGPFSPGPDKKTVFPNEFVIDYMRVWKLENDPIFREEESTVLPDYIENAIIDKHSTVFSKARLRRPVRFIFNKKEFKKHLGYISAIQESRGRLLIEKNGKFDETPILSLYNSNNKLLKEIELAESQSLLDVSEFKKGKYILKLKSKSLESSSIIEF
jgi:hypothetical protein